MEGSEADIYDDIDDDAIADAAASSTTRCMIPAEVSTLAECDNEPSSDLYDDIYSFETPRELQQAAEIKRLHGDVRELTRKLTDKESENHTLRTNMESLLLTARREIARKAAEITELQRTVIRYQTGKKLANDGGKAITLGSLHSGSVGDTRKADHSQNNMVSLTQGRQASNSTAIPTFPLKPEAGVLSSYSGQAAAGDERERVAVPLPLGPEKKQPIGSRADGGTAVTSGFGGIKKGNKLDHVAQSDVPCRATRPSLAGSGGLHQLPAAPAEVPVATAASADPGQEMDRNLSGARPVVPDCATSRTGSRSHGGGLCKNSNVLVVAGAGVTVNVSSRPLTLDEASLSTVRHLISTSDSLVNSNGSKHLNESRPSGMLHAPVSAGSSMLAEQMPGGSSCATSSPSENFCVDTKIDGKQPKKSLEPMVLSKRQLECDSGKKSYSQTLPPSQGIDSLRSSHPTRESSVVGRGRSCASELVSSSEKRSHVNPKGEALESAPRNGLVRSSTRPPLGENVNRRYDSGRKGNPEPRDGLEENGSFSRGSVASAGHASHSFRSERETRASLGKPEDKCEALEQGCSAERARGGWSDRPLELRDVSKVGTRLPRNDVGGRKYEGCPAKDRPKPAEEKVTPFIRQMSTAGDNVKGRLSPQIDRSSSQRAPRREEASRRSESVGSSRLDTPDDRRNTTANREEASRRSESVGSGRPDAPDDRRNATANRSSAQDKRSRRGSTDKRGNSSDELHLISTGWHFSPSAMPHAESGEEGNTSSRQRNVLETRQNDSNRPCKASDVRRSAASDVRCTASDVRFDNSEERGNGSGQRCKASESRNLDIQRPAFNDGSYRERGIMALREQSDSASTDHRNSQGDSRPSSGRSRGEGLDDSHRESRGFESRYDRDVRPVIDDRRRRDYLERDGRSLSSYPRHSRCPQDSELGPEQSWPKRWSSDPTGAPIERDFECRDDLEKRQPSASVSAINNGGRKIERRSREPERGHGPEASVKRHRVPSSRVTGDKYRRIDIEDGEVLSENERC